MSKFNDIQCINSIKKVNSQKDNGEQICVLNNADGKIDQPCIYNTIT